MSIQIATFKTFWCCFKFAHLVKKGYFTEVVFFAKLHTTCTCLYKNLISLTALLILTGQSKFSQNTYVYILLYNNNYILVIYIQYIILIITNYYITGVRWTLWSRVDVSKVALRTQGSKNFQKTFSSS
jgi:hypothetical protein